MAYLQAFLKMIEGWDASVVLFVQEHLRHPALTPIVKGITHLGDYGALAIVLTLVLLLIPQTRKVGAMAAVSLILATLVSNVWLKNAVGRARPYEMYDTIINLVGPERDSSFPSGHTMASFAVALVCLRALKPRVWGVLITILAALIALSRIYVGVHYPSDVLAGFLISLAMSQLVLILFDQDQPKGRRRRK